MCVELNLCPVSVMMHMIIYLIPVYNTGLLKPW
jgi:hypothetical protein